MSTTDDDRDNDSTLGIEGPGSSLTSLSPSMYEHVQEHGRTYHSYKNGKYILPNDEKEKDRLDYQHNIFLQLFDNQLAQAPVKNTPLHNVLDIATGTGNWAIDFAELHPSAAVTGTDLSPIQPSYVPPNCSFIIDDAEDNWIFTHNYDYIHARAVVTCFSDPKAVFKSAFNALAPGGYLEIQDAVFPVKYGTTPPEDAAFVKWNTLSLEAAAKGGRPWTNPPNYATWFKELGFEDVVEKKYTLPCGPWMDSVKDKSIGAWQLDNWLRGLEAMTLRNLARIGWSTEESLVLVAKVRSELVSLKLKPYNDVLVVYGRKPAAQEEATAESES